MKNIQNPFRGTGLPEQSGLAQGTVPDDDSLVQRLLAHCPAQGQTPLVDVPDLAVRLGISALYFKDERARMGLGSFKALGAAFSIAKAAHAQIGDQIAIPANAAIALKGHVYATASAGNHGLSVAAGARIFGAQAVIYLAETVPSGFANRLRNLGAEVVIQGEDYEASQAAAVAAATENGWQLISDSTWIEDTSGRDIMEGYLAMPSEVFSQFPGTPTHIFLQAGVGGLAGAVAASARKHWGDAPQITVVEPTFAPALQASIEHGGPVVATGPTSNMGRLDCKEPSHIALRGLARDADTFLTLDDEYVAGTIKQLEPFGLETSPSGGAGYAGLVATAANLGPDAKVLIILSEGPADD